jgi:hypothetical protein
MHALSVYRVNYLKAKARRDRWEEERMILKKERVWTISFFERQVHIWEARGESATQAEGWNSEGLNAYSKKQMKMWLHLKSHAEEEFGKVVL